MHCNNNKNSGHVGLNPRALRMYESGSELEKWIVKANMARQFIKLQIWRRPIRRHHPSFTDTCFTGPKAADDHIDLDPLNLA